MIKFSKGFQVNKSSKQNKLFILKQSNKKIKVHIKRKLDLRFPLLNKLKIKSIPFDLILLQGKIFNLSRWTPKNELPSPVPIIFQSLRYDNIIKRLLKKPLSKAKIIYLGPRYENTYFSWYKKPFTFPYTHMKSPHNIKFTDRQFCGQHW